MANPVAPKVKITLDKERTLYLSLAAMVAFEGETGKSFLRGFQWQDMTTRDFMVLLWACLLHEDEEISLKEAGNMVHPGNIGETMDALSKIWDGATTKKKESKKESPLPENRPNG